MIKSLETYSPDDIKKLAQRTTIVRKEQNNVSEDYTITKKSTVAISNNIAALHNAFNKILANNINIKALQEAQAKKGAPASKIVTVPVAANMVGAEELSGVINTLGKYFDELTKLFNASDDNKPQQQEQEVDIDVGKKRRGRRSRGRMRNRGLRGLPLESFDTDLDVFDDDEVSRNGKGNIRTSRGSLLGAAVGAIGVMGAGYLAAKAYSSATKESPAEKQLKAVATKTAAVPATRAPSEISNNSYSSRFADYLADTFENVKSYITGLAGGSLFGGGTSGGGGATGDYGDGAGSTENARIAMEFFMSPEGGGWTREQAAGIVGNLQGESTANLNPNAKGDNGNAYGIAQWNQQVSPDRVANFRSVIGTDLRSSSLQQQLEFVAWELQNTEKAAGNKLRNAKDVEAATVAMSQYERYKGYKEGLGSAETRKRVSNARALLAPRPEVGGAGLVSPLPGVSANSEFGMRMHPVLGKRRMHEGLDYPARAGTPILSSGNGTVVFVGDRGGYGKTIEVDHGGGTVTRYAHMSAFSVSKGSVVTQGQQIGSVGETGTATGPHLHFEVLQNGKPQDPRQYLNIAPDKESGPNKNFYKFGPLKRDFSVVPENNDMTRAMQLLAKKPRKSTSIIIPPVKQQAANARRISLPAQPVSRTKSRNRNFASDYTSYHGMG